MKKKHQKSDRFFLFSTLFILAVGLIILNSASAPFAYNKFGDTYYLLKGQILHGVLPGLILFVLAAKINYSRWKKWSKYLYIFTLVLLVLVFIPGIGVDYGKGAYSWLNLYFFSFQPAELAKFALIVLLSGMLSQPDRDLTDFQNGLLPVFATAAPLLLLILLQPDIGTLSIMCLTALIILILARVEGKVIGLLFLLGLVAFGLLVIIAPYRLERMSIFLHPELDPQGVGYHVNQAYLAVGSGGIWGTGYGLSRQKHLYLPEVHADSIFAVYAEEMGFFLSVLLVLIMFVFTLRGLKIAREAPDRFGYLLASGIMVWFFTQAVLNMAAMVGGSPLTGVPLPLISHGGSAMMFTLLALGVVLNISQRQKH